MRKMVFRELEELNKLPEDLGYELFKFLSSKFGKRGEKAFFYLKRSRIFKYNDFFIVKGRENYIVDRDFCTCYDFLFNLKCQKPCAHIIAVRVAEKSGKYTKIDEYYIDVLSKSKR